MPYRPLLTTHPTSSPKSILIRDISVFTATNSQLLLHQDVLLDQGKIQKISPTGQMDIQESKIIEGRGKTLLPGFIDTHVHVSFSGSTPYEDVSPDPKHNLHAFLYA